MLFLSKNEIINHIHDFENHETDEFHAQQEK
jgi:hypothetical protein